MPTVLPTLGHRDPRPRFFVGALRPTVGNTAGTIFLFLVRYFMTFQAYVYLSLPRSKDSDLRSLCKVRAAASLRAQRGDICTDICAENGSSVGP